MGKLFSSSCFMKTFPFNISFQLFLFDADSSKEQTFTPSVNQVTAYGLTPAPSQVLGTAKEPGKLVTRLLIETLHTNETVGITLWQRMFMKARILLVSSRFLRPPLSTKAVYDEESERLFE